MFGSGSAFGQSSANPFGSQSVFGQMNNPSSNPFTPKPFGSPNPFGSQTGSPIFGSTSTGVFGATQSSSPLSSAPAFGAPSTPAFGTSTTPTFGSPSPSFGGTSVFGQKPAFGGFGSSTPSSPFGSTFQQSQPSFGSNLFGSSSTPTFGSSSTPAFGSSTSTPAFGANTTPAFGANTTPAFGTNTTPAFGANSTPAFGSTNTTTFGNTGSGFGISATPFGSGGGFGASSTPTTFGSSSSPAFGATPTPSFGATSSPAFGNSNMPAFGNSNTPAFGVASTAAFGSSSTPSFSFGSSPTFGQTTSPFGSSPFGSTTSTFGAQPQSSAFGSQTTTPTFGSSGFGQSPFGAQRVGSRVAPYTPTTEVDTAAGQVPGKLESISAMPVYKDKSHEELRWEDYQQGDKGGPNPAGQSTSTIGVGASPTQSNLFASSSAFGQSSSIPFSTPTSSNLFGAKPSSFGSTGFGTTTSGFGSTGFGATNTPNPFGASSTATPSHFPTPSSTPFGSNTSPFGTMGSSAFGSSPSMFGSSTAQGATQSFASGLNFLNTSSQPFQSTTPSIGQTAGAFGQTGLSFGPTSTASFGQSSLFSTPSSFGGGNMFSNSSSLFGQTTPSLSTPFPSAQPTQTSNGFNFGNINQTQTGMGVFGNASSIFGQNVGQSSIAQSPAVVQPATITNPFGVLPTMPQISIGRNGTSPSIQYGISSMPVVDKPAPVRVSSLLTSRHLSQRRIKLPARKYHPKSDSQKVAFFSDDEKTPSTPKADAVFIPRENPRALIIRPMDHWSSKANLDKSSPLNDATELPEENGKAPIKENEHISNGSNSANKGKAIAEDESEKHEDRSKTKAYQGQYSNGIHDDHQGQKGDSYITLSGHRAGEAAIVYEHGADIEAMMPKLRHTDYYTEPRIQELAAKERAEPGFCRRVKDFVVGRIGFGSIKFFGETDVRRLDLESLIQFNNREVIVYMDDSKKPPVGQGLNKPAEVTLLGIKCHNKKTGEQITEGPRIEKYKEMLKRKAEDQGAEFVSYDPVRGEWKFKVNHFSSYKLLDAEGDEDDQDNDNRIVATLCLH